MAGQRLQAPLGICLGWRRLRCISEYGPALRAQFLQEFFATLVPSTRRIVECLRPFLKQSERPCDVALQRETPPRTRIKRPVKPRSRP
jgi:hypothetical protein